MSPAEQKYTVGNQEMLAIVMSCCYWRCYVKGARHPVEVLTDYYNFKMFMSTKSLTSQQACWWEKLSGYNLHIVYRVGKKNPATALSCQPEYTKIPKGLCVATVLTAPCNATFHFQEL
jgi:hypothetical protein